MVISKENDRAPGYQTGPFWNVPRISIAITLLAIIFLSAIQRIPYPTLVIPSAILSFLFFAVRYWWERGRLKAKPASTRLILGGLLFLGGATYGAIEVALGQADKLDLLALVIPAFLGGWLLRQGLMIKHRHQNGHITGG